MDSRYNQRIGGIGCSLGPGIVRGRGIKAEQYAQINSVTKAENKIVKMVFSLKMSIQRICQSINGLAS
jgi:hypothetical protein